MIFGFIHDIITFECKLGQGSIIFLHILDHGQ